MSYILKDINFLIFRYFFRIFLYLFWIIMNLIYLKNIKDFNFKCGLT